MLSYGYRARQHCFLASMRIGKSLQQRGLKRPSLIRGNFFICAMHQTEGNESMLVNVEVPTSNHSKAKLFLGLFCIFYSFLCKTGLPDFSVIGVHSSFVTKPSVLFSLVHCCSYRANRALILRRVGDFRGAQQDYSRIRALQVYLSIVHFVAKRGSCRMFTYNVMTTARSMLPLARQLVGRLPLYHRRPALCYRGDIGALQNTQAYALVMTDLFDKKTRGIG